MPETQKAWIKRLTAEGWTLERGGKHQVKMTKPGMRPITLPEKQTPGVLQGLRIGPPQAGRALMAIAS